ncbi:MAG TPA: AraC family transcriptional regulator [Actinotalea sp.]|nr:AraC family transcriptional regulator [Actinotalea sp.]
MAAPRTEPDPWPERDLLLGALSPELVGLMDELTGTMFCVKDAAGRYVAVNQAFVERTGERSRRTVVGRTAHDLFVPHLAEHYEAQDRQVLRTGQPVRRVLELIVRPGGVAGWYLTSKAPVRRDGEPIGLVSVSQDLRRHDAQDAVVASVERVVALVAERDGAPVDVGEMADAAGCSVSTLERRMHRVLSLSPQQYVLRTRIDRAAGLLAGSDLPIAEVAARAGFYDQALLTRAFGRLTGETPAQFRRRTARPRQVPRVQ